MRSARIAMVGGGLAGLYAAYLLERQSMHDYFLVEARTTLGGRIADLPAPILQPEASDANLGERRRERTSQALSDKKAPDNCLAGASVS